MIIDKVEAELRIIQTRRIDTHRQTVLTVIGGFVVFGARNHHEPLIGDFKRQDQPLPTCTEIRPVAEAEQHPVSTFTGEVIGAPVETGRVDFDLFPIVLIKTFKSQVLCWAD